MSPKEGRLALFTAQVVITLTILALQAAIVLPVFSHP
jgi:hypothetical protein